MNSCSTAGPGRRMGKIPVATSYSGISRSRLYQLAGNRPDLFRKLGKSVLVDFSVLDQILDKLPNAEIKPPPSPEPQPAKRERAATVTREPVDVTATRIA